jgi:hypothetical protein
VHSDGVAEKFKSKGEDKPRKLHRSLERYLVRHFEEEASILFNCFNQAR